MVIYKIYTKSCSSVPTIS